MPGLQGPRVIPPTRIYLTGSQRLSLLTALTDLVQVEDGNADLEEVLRKLGPPGQPAVIEGQTDIDDMLQAQRHDLSLAQMEQDPAARKT